MRPPRFTTPTVDVVEAAGRVEWIQATHPETGELLYLSDGNPYLVQKTTAQKLAPVARKWLWIRLMIRAYAALAVLLVLGYVAAQLLLPPAVAAPLAILWKTLAWTVVWGFAGLAIAAVVWAIVTVIRGVFGR